jgi:hypothetical protein
MRPVTSPPASDALSILSRVLAGIEDRAPASAQKKLSHTHLSVVESINHGS